MSLIAKTGLADRIVDILRDRIIAGGFPPHAAIRQEALATELGVSKIPLREAFAKLEQDGLILSEMNRGFFVKPLSAEEAQDVFDLRLKIEPDAVRVAAGRVTPADVKRARAALDALNASAADHDARAGSLNRAFHMALIQPGGDRPVTLQMVERLQVIAERYVVRHLEPIGRAERAIDEHEALFEAWAAGRGADAATLSAAHIAQTLDDLNAELQKAAR
jgi:DNA-binding GntR family transcriptional regulator